ncbi:hypothetical protein HN51_018243 [Arachis hypogaea]
MVYAGMLMLKHFMVEKVDKMMVLMSKLKYGNIFKYGLMRSKEGPFALKIKGGTTPTIDVYPGISSIKEGKIVKFVDGQHVYFMQSSLLLDTKPIIYSMRMECQNQVTQIIGKENMEFRVLDFRKVD